MIQKAKFWDEEEREAFMKFKTRVADLNQDNDTMIRFLRARDHDLDKAEEMLRKNVQWRLENNVDQYLHWRPSSPKWIEEFPMVFLGHDFEGSPVLYAPMGRWNTKEKLELGLRSDCEIYQYYMLETIMYHIRNSSSTQMVFICDQAGSSLSKVAHVESGQLFYAGFKTFEQHYPEILKKALVINTSWIFSSIFNFLKPVFTGTTMSKIMIFNSNKETYTKAMLEMMPEDVLPTKCISYFDQ